MYVQYSVVLLDSLVVSALEEVKIYIVLKPGLELGFPGPHSKALTTRLSGNCMIVSDIFLQSLLKKLADFFNFGLAVHEAKTFDFRRENVLLEKKV